MSLDLIVVNYHSPDDLSAFLGSLERYPPMAPTTLTIVDVDAPMGEEVSWAQGTAHRMGTDSNIGYGRACNLASKRCVGDVIACFNADVELTEGALDACHDALLGNDGWGVLGPRQVDSARRIRHAGILGEPTRPAHRGWNEYDRGQYADIREAVTVSGSAYFVRRSVWTELTGCGFFQLAAPGADGAFLPTNHYYEETWCSYHARAHGHVVVYFGQVTIVHKWHRASPVGGWAERQMPLSRQYFRSACDLHSIPRD